LELWDLSYEGTGRSLSLKLIQQLREQGNKLLSNGSVDGGPVSGRVFKEVELAEPIRYAAGDPIEAWLNELLCLNAANHISNIEGRSVSRFSTVIKWTLSGSSWPFHLSL
jgi:N-acetyltransferase 10